MPLVVDALKKTKMFLNKYRLKNEYQVEMWIELELYV